LQKIGEIAWIVILALIRGSTDVYFQTKKLLWVNILGSCSGRCWYVLYFLYSVYFTAIWYISDHFSIYFPFWYVVPRKIWQHW
jgi:hypothetical protein